MEKHFVVLRKVFQSVFLNSRVIIPKTVIFIDLCCAFWWSMTTDCQISGVLQKQVKRHNCIIPVKFPCNRGAWQILSFSVYSLRPSCWRKMVSNSGVWELTEYRTTEIIFFFAFSYLFFIFRNSISEDWSCLGKEYKCVEFFCLFFFF